jgi:hypothetical protein
MSGSVSYSTVRVLVPCIYQVPGTFQAYQACQVVWCWLTRLPRGPRTLRSALPVRVLAARMTHLEPVRLFQLRLFQLRLLVHSQQLQPCIRLSVQIFTFSMSHVVIASPLAIWLGIVLVSAATERSFRVPCEVHFLIPNLKRRRPSLYIRVPDKCKS